MKRNTLLAFILLLIYSCKSKEQIQEANSSNSQHSTTSIPVSIDISDTPVTSSGSVFDWNQQSDYTSTMIRVGCSNTRSEIKQKYSNYMVMKGIGIESETSTHITSKPFRYDDSNRLMIVYFDISDYEVIIYGSYEAPSLNPQIPNWKEIKKGNSHYGTPQWEYMHSMTYIPDNRKLSYK